MTLYFDTLVRFRESNVISTNQAWHSSSPLLAIASYSQDKGGFVSIFDDLGEPLENINFPSHSVSQVTALAWHPERHMLATGWENGDIKIWNENDKEFSNVLGPHKAPIIIFEFSEKGGRLVSCDSTGSLVGWKVDGKGQIITVFHHDLKESITHLTYRLTVKNQLDFDIGGLAKAAVNGDEQALDMFSNWRPKTTAKRFKIQDGNDNYCFFAGTQTGSIYHVNENGACVEVLNTEGVPLSYILHHPNKNALVVMMEGLMIGYFTIDSHGQLTEITKVKLSGRGQAVRGVGSQTLVWISNNCLAILTGDLTVRVWDIDSNDNYVLPVKVTNFDNEDKIPLQTEMFSCISYSKLNQTLCAGTNSGRIYLWTRKQSKQEYFDNPEESWDVHNVNKINGTIKHIVWGSFNLRLPLLGVNCVTKVYIMKEQTACTCFSEKIWATQKSANQILLQTTNCNSLVTVNMQVTNMSINKNSIAFTNGRLISIYNIVLKASPDKITYESNLHKQTSKPIVQISLANSFSCDNEGIILHGGNIIALTSGGVVIRSGNGSVVASMLTVPVEGEPIGMDVTANYLTIFTMEGFLKIYDLAEAEPKLVTPVRNLYDMCSDFGEIIQAKTNSSGNKVALTLASASLIPDGKLYIWDIEHDNLILYDFCKYNCSKSNTFDDFGNIENDIDDCSDNLDETQIFYNKICSNRIPLSLHWDNEDPRLLICNAKRLKLSNYNVKPGFVSLYGKAKSDEKNLAKPSLEDEEHVVVTMFVSFEHGIRIQDIRAVESNCKLLALATPFIVLQNNSDIVREIMSDFNGLETCNKKTKEAILDFSYNISLGNMDAAFKAIKLIQSPGVWNSLARMCVKTRRLDVAGVCLGHMGDARAARALRLAMSDSTLPQEAKLAVLAIQLNMLDEAEQLYLQCERYDLLNKFYQNCNKMESAVKIAETKDRIHLKHTEHTWARMFEQAGNFKEAIVHYERANTHLYEVPRMLSDQPRQLELYMAKVDDPDQLRWWGQYVESQGDINMALKIYSKAGDVYNQVRSLCFMDEEQRAVDLAQANTDKAAFYHLARYFETNGKVDDAVRYFNKANAYSNSVRLCKENHMAENLWNIGLVAGNREKLECAKYFEEVGSSEKAIILFHRAGMLHKALELSFDAQQFDILQQITTNLDTDSDPALIKKCAEYFVSNQQFDKAVDLLAVGKRYKEAIEICMSHNVQLTEDLAEKLTPEKDQLDEATKNVILENLAESLMVQGNYHLATKKFTQAGDRVRAMKALLKSGDTEKIIFFAGVSRQREIYIMAANYLQSLDWQNQPEILKNIITFYSKGKAQDLLANFYVACAQIEIDEFQNYEKAYGALTEASRCLSKIPNSATVAQYQRATEIVQKRMTTIKRFIDIRRLFERGDSESGMTQCKQFLLSGGADLEESVRRGDVYALMIQNYVKNSNFYEAKQLIGELRQLLSTSGTVSIGYYLNKELIEALARGLGVAPSTLIPPTTKASADEDAQGEGEIEEEIEN